MSKQKLTYKEAVSELELILKTMEDVGEVDIDSITVKIKRASELMDFCKKQLTELDLELEKAMKTLG